MSTSAGRLWVEKLIRCYAGTQGLLEQQTGHVG